jgi:hypothetical protein
MTYAGIADLQERADLPRPAEMLTGLTGWR